MKTPFSNFFKKVFQHKADRPQPINKPAEQVKEERKTPVKIPKAKKCTRRPPVFNNRLESMKRAKRKIKNRIEGASRKVNRYKPVI